jgi:hypothetical protein
VDGQVVTMMDSLQVRDSTALSPEWDRWFDEEFTDLISEDDDLVRAEFDALIAATWPPPPTAPPPPAPPAPGPGDGTPHRPAATPPDTQKNARIKGDGRLRHVTCQRSPPW